MAIVLVVPEDMRLRHIPTQVAVDQIDRMIVTRTVVWKTQELAYNQSAAVRNELIHKFMQISQFPK